MDGARRRRRRRLHVDPVMGSNQPPLTIMTDELDTLGQGLYELLIESAGDVDRNEGSKNDLDAVQSAGLTFLDKGGSSTPNGLDQLGLIR